MVFVGTILVVSITSSHVINELSTILPKYLPFSELHGRGFQT